jgi:hypothetical protein
MGARLVQDGQIVIDLNNVQLTVDQQKALLNAVRATVVSFLAGIAGSPSVVAFSILPNNNGEAEA